MRYILALILTIATVFTASAENNPSYAGKINNQSGGEIVLLLSSDRPICQAKGKYLDVIAYNKEGETLEGCWTILVELSLIRIYWDGGETRVYPTSIVELHPSIEGELKAKNRTRQEL